MTVEGDNGNPGSQHKIYNSNITSKKKTTKCLGKKINNKYKIIFKLRLQT